MSVQEIQRAYGTLKDRRADSKWGRCWLGLWGSGKLGDKGRGSGNTSVLQPIGLENGPDWNEKKVGSKNSILLKILFIRDGNWCGSQQTVAGLATYEQQVPLPRGLSHAPAQDFRGQLERVLPFSQLGSVGVGGADLGEIHFVLDLFIFGNFLLR